jgi:uracil-DNA glycosylase
VGEVDQPARWTRPALRHEVHTLSLRGVPFTTARTFWMLGFHRRGERRWEWETCIPKPGFFPQMSHTDAMAMGW